MLALAIVIAVIVLLAFLRFGVIAEYNKEGFRIWAKAGFIKFELLKGDKKKQKKPKKPKKDKKGINVKPGSLKEFKEMLKAVFDMLGRFKRRLLIKELKLYYTSASENPVSTALQYGAANAFFALIVPKIKKSFRVKKLDMKTGFDFTTQEQGIYAKANLSIAVWEAIYVVFALMPIITSAVKKSTADANTKNKQKDGLRKEGKAHGKTPDKRFDGNHDAKSEGTD